MNTQIVRSLGTPFSFCAIALTSTGLAVLAGCAMPGKAPVQPPIAAAENPQPKAPEVKEPGRDPAPDQKTLAAIEDFLSRTQQYRQTAPIVGTTPPLKPDVTDPLPQAKPTPIDSPTIAEGSKTVPAPKQTATNTELIAGEPAAPQPVLPVPAVERVTIEWRENSDSEEAPARPNTANTPMTASASEREPASKRMIDELETEAESRKDFESHWRLKLGQLAMGRDEEAAEAVTLLPSDSASLLSALVGASVAVRSAASDPLDQAAAALTKIDELRALVAHQADPAVSSIALCRKVLTFGAYEEMPQEEFVSGRTIQLIVYSEVGNFRSRKTDEGAYETQLATKLEVFTKTGESVWQREEPEVIDTCRNLRRDFFVAQRVTLPPTLPAGEYVLKVRVEDKLAAKAGEAAKPFTIHSPISVAKKP